jgi:hypothetical protein
MPLASRRTSIRSWVAVLCVALAGQVLPHAVGHAQDVEPRVGVFRATSTSTSVAVSDAVDAALLRDLASLAGIASPVVSPVDYAEIQLSVGCSDESRTCFESIARTANVESLLVRTLDAAPNGNVRLELRYFDLASSDAPTRVSTDVPADQASTALAEAVPALVRELFGIPKVVAPAAPADPPPPQFQPSPKPTPAAPQAYVSALTWVALGVGAVALTAGAVIGIAAEQDFERWKRQPIRSAAQAEQASADFEGLQDRAVAANILIPAGAVVLALGATLLVFDLSDGDHAAQLSVAPLFDGERAHVLGRMRGTF